MSLVFCAFTPVVFYSLLFLCFSSIFLSSVTRRANHARDHLQSVGLEKVDGLVSVLTTEFVCVCVCLFPCYSYANSTVTHPIYSCPEFSTKSFCFQSSLDTCVPCPMFQVSPVYDSLVLIFSP